MSKDERDALLGSMNDRSIDRSTVIAIAGARPVPSWPGPRWIKDRVPAPRPPPVAMAAAAGVGPPQAEAEPGVLATQPSPAQHPWPPSQMQPHLLTLATPGGPPLCASWIDRFDPRLAAACCAPLSKPNQPLFGRWPFHPRGWLQRPRQKDKRKGGPVVACGRTPQEGGVDDRPSNVKNKAPSGD